LIFSGWVTPKYILDFSTTFEIYAKASRAKAFKKAIEEAIQFREQHKMPEGFFISEESSSDEEEEEDHVIDEVEEEVSIITREESEKKRKKEHQLQLMRYLGLASPVE
jgi:cell division protein YceG involved in septum cleavage